jgi:hypothetical protein
MSGTLFYVVGLLVSVSQFPESQGGDDEQGSC